MFEASASDCVAFLCALGGQPRTVARNTLLQELEATNCHEWTSSLFRTLLKLPPIYFTTHHAFGCSLWPTGTSYEWLDKVGLNKTVSAGTLSMMLRLLTGPAETTSTFYTINFLFRHIIMWSTVPLYIAEFHCFPTWTYIGMHQSFHCWEVQRLREVFQFKWRGWYIVGPPGKKAHFGNFPKMRTWIYCHRDLKGSAHLPNHLHHHTNWMLTAVHIFIIITCAERQLAWFTSRWVSEINQRSC